MPKAKEHLMRGRGGGDRTNYLSLVARTRSKLGGQGGFSIIEMIVVVLLAMILGTAGLLFLRGTTNAFNSQEVRILNQDDARTAMNQVTRYLRMATDSADNTTSLSNALATTLAQDIEFFCDVDGDTVAEKVRYYLDGDILMSQTEDPVWVAGTNGHYVYGAYDTDGVVIENRVRNGTSPVFVYYRQGVSGLEQFNPGSDEARRTVVSVGIFIRVGERPDLAARDVFLSTQVQIRQRYSGGLDL